MDVRWRTRCRQLKPETITSRVAAACGRFRRTYVRPRIVRRIHIHHIWIIGYASVDVTIPVLGYMWGLNTLIIVRFSFHFFRHQDSRCMMWGIKKEQTDIARNIIFLSFIIVVLESYFPRFPWTWDRILYPDWHLPILDPNISHRPVMMNLCPAHESQVFQAPHFWADDDWTDSRTLYSWIWWTGVWYHVLCFRL